jgi:hypothetical protein
VGRAGEHTSEREGKGTKPILSSVVHLHDSTHPHNNALIHHLKVPLLNTLVLAIKFPIIPPFRIYLKVLI